MRAIKQAEMMKRPTTGAESRLWAVCLTLALLVALAALAETRYLPTRSDESELEALKDIISNILNEAGEHQRERHQLMAARATRFFSTRNNNRARQLASSQRLANSYEQPPAGQLDGGPPLGVQRRAAELAAGDANGDDNEQFGEGPAAMGGAAGQRARALLRLQEKAGADRRRR